MADIEQLLGQLTLDEKVSLVSGASAWRSNPVPRLDIPVLKMSDGPNGVRGDGGGGSRSAAFPVGVCLASTFDTTLLARLGEVIAAEARSKHVDVVLGPTINIQRSPLGGRNFECYSEDPHLSGQLAVAFVARLQAEGVAGCVKHYVCNDSEFERHSISVEVDERTLREIYLRPFELAVKRAGVWSVMGAYNRINGVFACSHDTLVNGVLKNEWGFDGYVVSDWFAALETVDNAIGGLDMEMPGPPQAWGGKLAAAVTSGEVPEATIDDKVRRILRTLERTGKFERPEDAPEQHDDDPAARDLALELASAGMVLLRNNGGVLPFNPATTAKLAVIGPNVLEPQVMGGGSSQVNAHTISLPLAALQARLPGAEVSFEPGVLTHKYIPGPPAGALRCAADADRNGLTVTTWPTSDFSGNSESQRNISRAELMFSVLNGDADVQPRSVRAEGVLNADTGGEWTFGLAQAGRARMYLDDEEIIDNWTAPQRGDLYFGNGSTEVRAKRQLEAGRSYRLRIDYSATSDVRWQALRYGVLPPVPDDLLDRAVASASAADAVVLLVGTSRDWETEGNDRTSMQLPGQQDQLISAVCAANPNTVVVLNTGSPVSMPWLSAAPAVLQAWFAGQEFGAALAQLLFGDVSPSGRLPLTFPRRLQDTPAFGNYPGEFGSVRYGEGLLVGYRWYDARDLAPLFPFGHGLSYTTFDYGNPVASGTPGADSFRITVPVTNTGQCAGAEVVQAYVAPPHQALVRAPKELKAFTRVHLEPGATASVELAFDAEAFAYWDPLVHAWHTEPGDYRVVIAASSRDVRCELVVAVHPTGLSRGSS